MSSDAPQGTKLFQISEPDLQKLEAILPRIVDRMGPAVCAPDMQVAVQEVREILSNVRWNYGPPTQMTVIPYDPA